MSQQPVKKNEMRPSPREALAGDDERKMDVSTVWRVFNGDCETERFLKSPL